MTETFKSIDLFNGLKTLVSLEDFDYFSQWKWSVKKTKRKIYACRLDYTQDKPKQLRLHRLIAERMGLNIENFQIDHIDGNGLNNQRLNLRLATNRQNSQNKRDVKNKTGYKGVYFNKHNTINIYRARIKVNGNPIDLGHYPTPQAAAQAYDAAAIKYFGEFAATNFN